jgi:hypothetical protein
VKRPPSALEDSLEALVLDASVLINLLGSRMARQILAALGVPSVVEETTLLEVLVDPQDGSSATPAIDDLILSGSLLCERMDDDGLTSFISLVGAEPPDDLGDGEAATLAHALRRSATAVIDERKATRIARTQFPNLNVCSSLDIFACSRVVEALGADALSDALFGAVKFARMRVSVEYDDWVRGIPGPQRIAECRSLRVR